MEWNYEGFIDEYGLSVFDTPDHDVLGPDGELIDVGIIEHWQNEADGLKGDHDALNEFYRQFPKTTDHAFRDEAKGSIFNLVKIYEQIDYNEEMSRTLGVTKTCLRLGSRIIGKCMMGSTSNALDKGGDNFKKLYNASDVTKRNRNGQTKSGLYSLFIPMEWNYEGFIDEHGVSVFDTPDYDVFDPNGELIDVGILEHWQNEADGLKSDHDALNEFYRQFPRTTVHAVRD